MQNNVCTKGMDASIHGYMNYTYIQMCTVEEIQNSLLSGLRHTEKMFLQNV